MGTNVTVKDTSELTNLEISVILGQDPWLQGFLTISIDFSLVHEAQLISPQRRKVRFTPL